VRMPGPPSADEPLRVQRSLDYAEGTAVLDEDHEVPGAAAIFEQALCNGLAVIVTARWPNSELDSKGNVKSAKKLIEVIVAEEARSGQTGHVLMLNERTSRTSSASTAGDSHGRDKPEPDAAVRVEVAVLREALLATAPRRHAKRSRKPLERKHVDALIELDTHPQLNVLTGEFGNRQMAREKVRDLWRRDQSEDYLAILSADEIERRVSAAQDLLPSDPKDRLTSLGLTDCPVCSQETLLAERLDYFGVGIASGTCFVCGYYRSCVVVDQEAVRHMWHNKWKHE
jgi:hypothetical protein